MTLDYERLWKQLWIENLEEEINKSEHAKIQRQEIINKKYPLTKEDILMFTNIFYNIRLDKLTKVLYPSEYMLLPWTELIPFWHRNEIVNDISKEKIILYFKLLQRKFILIHLENYIIHNSSEKNINIKNLLEEYRLTEDSPQNRNYIKFQWYWESLNQNITFIDRIKNIFSPKLEWVEIKRKWANFFINDLLDERMENFIENLDYWIDFNIAMVDKNLFVWNILLEIESFITKVEKPIQIENIFKDIKEQIENKINHPWSIKLSYPLSDYIDSKNFYFDIIYDLHKKEYLTVKEIFIFESSVNFVIEKINRFNESVKNELYPIYERLSFEWWNLKLDSKLLIWWKKKWQKIYELIDIIILWIKKHKRLNITYKELREIYFENKKRFPYLSTSINKNWNYTLYKEKVNTEVIEELKEMYNTNIENLINNVFCLPYFNSSLSKEKHSFILKENEAWLGINQD